MAIKKLLDKVETFSLELTNICNLNCDFCANKFMTREKGIMDVELAKRLIKETKEIRFCNEIATNVMGDPLLYKDIFEVLKYANLIQQDIILITNGENLDENILPKLFEFPPAIISISYHSNSEQSHSYKHPLLTYEQYKKRIFELVELKFKLDIKTRIEMNIISTFNTPHDKFKILNNNEDMDLFKVEWLNFAEFIKKKYRISWSIPSSIYPGANMLLPDFCINFYLFYHLWSNSILPSETKVIPSQKCLCYNPFTQFNVLWNGDLTFCCLDYNGDLVYDNIKNISIIEAFNSDKITKIRKNFIEGKDIPRKCSFCYGKIVNIDGTEYNPVKGFFKLSTSDNFKRIYFRVYRFLWKIATSRFNYNKLIPYLKIQRWLIRKCWTKYYIKNHAKQN